MVDVFGHIADERGDGFTPTGPGRPFDTRTGRGVLPGRTLSNLVICRLGAGGKLSLTNTVAECDLIADVLG